MQSLKPTTRVHVNHVKKQQAVPVRRATMKLKNKCGQCGHEYALTAQTASLYVFTKAPGMSYIEGECPQPSCEAEELIFFGDSLELGELVKLQWQTVDIKTNPTDAIKRAYYKASGGAEVQPVALTVRQDELVGALGRALAETPDDLLMDMFASPPPKSFLPKRWT